MINKPAGNNEMNEIKHSVHGLLFAIMGFVVTSAALAQESKQDSLWRPMKVFLGSWHGKGGGEPGTGDYVRTYQFVLNKRYIEIKNKSAYPPSADNPRGEVHEDWGYLSFDKARHTFVLRQFHIEGFVNQYRLDSLSADGKRMVFVSEAIENITPGWRARESYDILNENQIQETFELAGPSKPFEIYTRVLLNRN